MIWGDERDGNGNRNREQGYGFLFVGVLLFAESLALFVCLFAGV